MDTENQQPTAPTPPEPSPPPASSLPAVPPTTSTSPTTPASSMPAVTAADANSNDRLWSLLSYIFTPIVPAIVLAMDDTKNKPFPRFHAIQALGFFGAIVLYTIVASVVFICGSIVTLGLGGCVLWILFLLPLIPAIYYGVQAYNGKYFSIPTLTDFMVKQGWLQRPW